MVILVGAFGTRSRNTPALGLLWPPLGAQVDKSSDIRKNTTLQLTSRYITYGMKNALADRR